MNQIKDGGKMVSLQRPVLCKGDFPGGASGKEPNTHLYFFSVKAREIQDTGSAPGLERSPGGEHDNSFLKNLMDRRAGWALVHRAPKSWT